MTEATAQDKLHVLYEGDNSTPSATSSDYLSRRTLLNTGIDLYDTVPNVLWRENYGTVTGSDGDTTTDGSDSVDCPTDFVFPLGFVRTVNSAGASTYYQRKTVGFHSKNDNKSGNYYYVTGNRSSGYVINFGTTPATSQTMKYEYYKLSTQLDDVDDVIEMADPSFAIYFALSRLFFQDGQSDKAAEAMAIADSKLTAMKTRNEMMGEYQDSRIESLAEELGQGGFGTSGVSDSGFGG